MQKHLLVSALLLLAATLTVACSREDSNFSQSALFHDSAAQAQFVATLKQEGIPHRVDDKNIVWYPASAEDRVKQIRNTVIATAYPGPNSISIAREDERKMFIEALKKEGIQYEQKTVKYKEGETDYITWKPEDNDRVEAILKRVRAEFNRAREAQQKGQG